MNSVENEVYNNGVKHGISVYHTESGDVITKEEIEYKGIFYLFTFLHGEIIDCRIY